MSSLDIVVGLIVAALAIYGGFVGWKYLKRHWSQSTPPK